MTAMCLPAFSVQAQWLPTGPALGGAVVSLATDSQYVYAATGQGRIWRRPIGELITGVRRQKVTIPAAGSLASFPNPCNASTVFEFVLPADSRTSLDLYDVLGRKTLTVVHLPLQAGVYQWTADLSSLSTGVYLAVLTTGDLRLTRRILLVR